jgi:hypothetical protein
LTADELEDNYPKREIKLPEGVLYDMIYYDQKSTIHYAVPDRRPRQRNANKPTDCPGCVLIMYPEVIKTPEGMKPKWTNLDKDGNGKFTYIKRKSGEKFKLEC